MDSNISLIALNTQSDFTISSQGQRIEIKLTKKLDKNNEHLLKSCYQINNIGNDY